MKNLITTTLGFLFTLSLMAQNIWVADNRPTAPSGAHVFSTINAAIAAASPGDIIHVIPSQTFYSNPTLNKDSISIYGIGFNPDKDQPNKVWVEDFIISSGVFGARISGININDDLIIGSSAGESNGNIFLENLDVNRIAHASTCCTASSLSNVVIRNCVIGIREASNQAVIEFTGNYINATSLVITNCVIMGTSSTSGAGSVNILDAIIKNNLFLGNGSNDNSFGTVSNSTISNNIFLGRVPGGSNVTNSTFSNNLSFGTENDVFSIGSNGNTGANNIEATDPLIVGVTAVDDWDYSYDPTLDPSSPAVSAGNDGNDIGITGGTIPFSVTGTPLPVIKVLRIPEIIKQGDDLDATIEAVGN